MNPWRELADSLGGLLLNCWNLLPTWDPTPSAANQMNQ